MILYNYLVAIDNNANEENYLNAKSYFNKIIRIIPYDVKKVLNENEIFNFLKSHYKYNELQILVDDNTRLLYEKYINCMKNNYTVYILYNFESESYLFKLLDNFKNDNSLLFNEFTKNYYSMNL